jgi:hypothetical protein
MMCEHNLKLDLELNILDSSMDEEQFESTEYKIIDSELLSAAILILTLVTVIRLWAVYILWNTME